MSLCSPTKRPESKTVNDKSSPRKREPHQPQKCSNTSLLSSTDKGREGAKWGLPDAWGGREEFGPSRLFLTAHGGTFGFSWTDFV